MNDDAVKAGDLFYDEGNPTNSFLILEEGSPPIFFHRGKVVKPPLYMADEGWYSSRRKWIELGFLRVKKE